MIYKSKANTPLDYIHNWFLVNALTLNIDMTNIVKFSSQHYQDETFLINCQNNTLKESTITKFVGLKLEKHINWKNHLNETLLKLSSACLVIRSVYSYSNMPTLKMI